MTLMNVKEYFNNSDDKPNNRRGTVKCPLNNKRQRDGFLTRFSDISNDVTLPSPLLRRK